MEIVALDISSTSIGVCLLRDGDPVDVWSWSLRGTLYQRCEKAYHDGIKAVDLRQDSHTVLAIEAPAYSRHEHVAIQRVTGAVLAGWLNRLPNGTVVEIAPNTAKKALTNSGKADKEMMMQYAQSIMPDATFTEHSADALAVGLAAYGKLRQQELETRV